MAWWENSALNSVGNAALLDGLLLPHDGSTSVGFCLATCTSSFCRGLVVAENLSIGGGRVLSLLRVVGPVFGVSSSSLLMCVSLSDSEVSGS